MASDLIEVYLPVFRAGLSPALLLDDELVVVDANDAYVALLGVSRSDLVGRYVFDAFPGNPDDAAAPQALEASMRRALATGRADRLPLLQYDLPGEEGQGFDERWWTLVNVPVRDSDGQLRWLLNAVDDVTEVVRERRRGERQQAAVEGSAGAYRGPRAGPARALARADLARRGRGSCLPPARRARRGRPRARRCGDPR